MLIIKYNQYFRFCAVFHTKVTYPDADHSHLVAEPLPATSGTPPPSNVSKEAEKCEGLSMIVCWLFCLISILIHCAIFLTKITPTDAGDRVGHLVAQPLAFTTATSTLITPSVHVGKCQGLFMILSDTIWEEHNNADAK